ncbi:MAG: catalytic domain of component of various dehydrogenase complexe [Gammaproteobacteria bacterium]|nr:catalytic domain of component of various dehydrogenase complexe [Gammaproteobacteria bacterium]
MFGIQLARQGQTMEHGTLVEWKKREGDDMLVGEELYEVETEKAVVPIEVTRPGRLLKLLVQPGENVSVGTTLALAADPGESVPSAEIDAAVRRSRGVVESSASAGEKSVASGAESSSGPPSGANRPVAVPKARALAQELGFDLTRVRGSGEGGTILPQDVRKAASAATAKLRRVPLTPIARTSIAALERASQIPQFTQGVLVDATGLEKAKAASGRSLSYMDFFLEAIVRAAAQVPDVLASIAQNEMVYSETVDITIATATDAGLLIPVFRDAGGMSIEQRAPRWRQLVRSARAGTLTVQEMSGGIVALSNLGTRGIDYGTPLLPYGHSAIIFIGALATRPMVVDEKLTARPSLHLAVTYDHRIADGLLASRFTHAIHDALLTP